MVTDSYNGCGQFLTGTMPTAAAAPNAAAFSLLWQVL